MSLDGQSASGVVELDVARASVMSPTVVTAMLEHLRTEQQHGAYEAFALAQPVLRRARARLALLVGMEGERVELVDNGTHAMRSLLDAWPLAAGDRVLLPASEFASNRLALERLVARRGIRVEQLDGDGDGRIDVDAVARSLRLAPAAAIVISHVQSQRGVVQPLGELIAVARQEDVPVLADLCQAAGHVPAVEGAAAVTGTSRKWLHGPRGVGFVIVHSSWRDRLAGPPTLQTQRLKDGAPQADPSVALFEADEGAIAAWVGLAAALDELASLASGPPLERLAAAGPVLRRALADAVPELELGEPVEEPTAIVTIRPPDDEHGVAMLEALAAAGMRAGMVPAGRARDSPTAVVRLSPAPWVTDADLLRAADVAARSQDRSS